MPRSTYKVGIHAWQVRFSFNTSPCQHQNAAYELTSPLRAMVWRLYVLVPAPCQEKIHACPTTRKDMQSRADDFRKTLLPAQDQNASSSKYLQTVHSTRSAAKQQHHNIYGKTTNLKFNVVVAIVQVLPASFSSCSPSVSLIAEPFWDSSAPCQQSDPT